MSARQGFKVTYRNPAQSQESPNAVIPEITVEIRAFWPARMGNEPEVLSMLTRALTESFVAVCARTEPSQASAVSESKPIPGESDTATPMERQTGAETNGEPHD